MWSNLSILFYIITVYSARHCLRASNNLRHFQVGHLGHYQLHIPYEYPYE